eukprot:1814285-Lingulodinium_polyedra.AAC.1
MLRKPGASCRNSTHKSESLKFTQQMPGSEAPAEQPSETEGPLAKGSQAPVELASHVSQNGTRAPDCFGVVLEM